MRPVESTTRPTPHAEAPVRRSSSRLPRLLDEAAHAFAQRGYAAASVRNIAGRVGMLPGSMYCHFETKEALLVAVYREGVDRIGSAVDLAVATAEEPWQRLEAACIAHLATLLDQTDYSQVVIRVRPSDAPAAAPELIQLRDSYEKRFARLVAALPLARPTDRSTLRLMLMGALNWSQTWYRQDGGLAPDRIARRFVGLLKANLAAPAKEPA